MGGLLPCSPARSLGGGWTGLASVVAVTPIDISNHANLAGVRMEIVYLDHQVLVDQSGWAKSKGLSDAGEIHVVTSNWTIREMVRAD